MGRHKLVQDRPGGVQRSNKMRRGTVCVRVEESPLLKVCQQFIKGGENLRKLARRATLLKSQRP
jgi:hypothetical protein